MYTQSFYLTENSGNNALDFAIRPNPKLFVPSLIEGSLSDIKITKETTFEAQNDDGKVIACHGLANFIKLIGRPIYIFDNHNHAFAFWHFEHNKGKFQAPTTLIHIDQHKDMREPTLWLSPESATDNQKVFEYTNGDLNVGNFIPPSLKTGLIKDIIFIDSEKNIDEFHLTPETDYILDIDLDFFAPELNYIGNDKKIRLIQNLLPKAKVVTFATSPFFIDQKLALHYLFKIMNYHE